MHEVDFINIALISFWNTGVKMFFVSGQGSVTTLSQPQTLIAYQFVNYQPGTVNNAIIFN